MLNKIFDKRFIDWKTFLKSLGALAATMALMMATGGFGYLFAVPVMVFAFFQKKTEAVLFWVTLSITIMISGSGLVPKDYGFMLGYRIVLVSFGLVMLGGYAGQRKAKSIAPFALVIPYLLFMIVPSSVGWSPMISFLKMFLFITIYAAFLGVSNQVAMQRNVGMIKIRGMIFSLLCYLIIGSVLAVPFPAISQLSGEEYLFAVERGQAVVSLFRGVTWHSQTLGPVVAVVAVFVLGDWLFCVKRFSWLHAILMGACPYLLYMTSSRTAMGGTIIGMLVLTFCLMKERGIGARWRAKVKSAMVGLVIAAVVAVAAVPALRDEAVRFALKTNDTATQAGDFDVENVMSSRQGLIDLAMFNFRRSPIVGNGFQVSYDMQYKKMRSWKDYLSAPIEKGVWTAAILEEGGVVGMFFFLLFIICAGTKLFLSRSYLAFSLLVTLIVLNFGEFTMFSMSGVGGFLWVLVFVGAAFDSLRLRGDAQGLAGNRGVFAPPPDTWR